MDRLSTCSSVGAVVIVGGMLAASVTPAAGSASGRQAPQELRLGTVVTARASDDTPVVFRFRAEDAGFLTVVVRGTGDADLQFAVTDDVGQPLQDGSSDRDLGGDQGAEQLAVALPRAGEYFVRVSTWYGSGEFKIAASFLPFPDIRAEPDPDGQPTRATVLRPGTPLEDSLDVGGGDPWDWFAVSADSAGVLTVITEAPEGDLVLEVFAEGSYAEATDRSDQDMQGVSGNESITVRVEAGQTYYFKVSTFFGTEGLIPYTIRAGIM